MTPFDTAEAAVKGRDIVLCSTSSLDPGFFKKWVEPGMHLSTIKGHEIEPAAINACDLTRSAASPNQRAVSKPCVVPQYGCCSDSPST